eukprot:Nitzschia sp. Nitz4//scaffold244_size29068//16581//18566//NITZ4_008066-RA/size29068-processed-gene-0.7-mRNA-1//1//CDS//3329543862//7737//frame0
MAPKATDTGPEKTPKKKTPSPPSSLRIPLKPPSSDGDAASQPQPPTRKESAAVATKASTKASKKEKVKVARTKSGSDADALVSPKKNADRKVKRAKSSTADLAPTSSDDNQVSTETNKKTKASKTSALSQIEEHEQAGTTSESMKPAAKVKSKSKSTQAIRGALQADEQALAKEKGLISKSSATPTTPKAKAVATKPGAYQVQGSNVARVTSGILSPHASSSTSSSSATAVASKPAAASKSVNPTPAVAIKGPPPSNKEKGDDANDDLIVAAQLPADMEAHIEQEVRRRILAQAAKAQVVSVAHGIPMLDPKEEARRVADLRELHRPRGVREKLFGDTRNREIDIASSPESIRKRNYLKWTVKRNQTTNLWVATVQTKQKAVEQNDVIEVERTSVSFSATTQQEAFETGLANAVPIMQPTEEFPICYVCKAKFALFRRPQHCRNCGVCVCNNCTTQWPLGMFPETYRAKSVNTVCIACDWLACSFRDALLQKNYRGALHMYATGNVNLRTPFCLDKKAEAMYPIHLAVLGGCLPLVQWLVVDRFCPITVPRKPSRGKKQGTESPLLTSKGRSPMAIALLHQKLDVVRYLVAERGVVLFDENLNANLALANFTTVLKMLPANFFEGKIVQPTAVPHRAAVASSIHGNSPTSAKGGMTRRPSL